MLLFTEHKSFFLEDLSLDINHHCETYCESSLSRIYNGKTKQSKARRGMLQHCKKHKYGNPSGVGHVAYLIYSKSHQLKILLSFSFPFLLLFKSTARFLGDTLFPFNFIFYSSALVASPGGLFYILNEL